MKDTAIHTTGKDGTEIDLFLSHMDETTAEYLQRFPLDDDEEHCPAEYFTPLLRYIYTHCFKPTAANRDIYERNAYQNSQNSILDYSDILGLDRIFDSYLELCARFKQCPTILGFCTMTGIDKDTITSWANGSARGKSHLHMGTVKTWLNICESALAQRAIMSNSIGSIFALKCNFRWVETAPALPEQYAIANHDSAEAIAQRHASARLPERPAFDEVEV